MLTPILAFCRIGSTRTPPEGGSSMDALAFVFYAIVAFFAIGTILSGFFQVRTAEAVVIQRMGKFLRVANAGINFKLPWLDQIAGRLDLRVQQLALDVETKTKDNVFVKIPVSVQYHVIPDKVYEAFYKLANPKQQISSYVFNVILGHVPKMILDDAFLQQSDIAVAIKEGLDDVMKTYGYAIDQALVTDIEPDEKVKSAMNEINAAQREQVAAQARGEAEKILKVKQAEAEAESKALQGQGIANQRSGILCCGRRGHHGQGRDDAGPRHTVSRHVEGHRRPG
jgi:regulator of protease activity HflC (stomatin/prohibitin superfamily)